MNENATDYFEVVDGPEDGVEYPITRTPVDIGSNPDCGIFMNFDRAVSPHHARVTVVSGGYRVRSMARPSVMVDGKHSGKIFARIVRNGGVIRVGATSFCLRCAPDGLASRSIGIPLESNWVWLLRSLGSKTWRLLDYPLRLLLSVPRKILGMAVPLILLLAAVQYFRPGLIQYSLLWIRSMIQWGIWKINQFL
jgi:hypothetical protein